MTWRASTLAVSLLVSAGPAGQAHAESRQEAFALIVTNSRSLNKAVGPLRYADDDGARFHELTSSFATKTILLSVLDEQTQRTFPALAKISRQPTRRELIKAMGEIRGAVLQARKRGSRTVFYFYFAGHGDVGADRQGYINLLNSRFSRADLYREVIARSPADLNHIIIDACNAYFLVNRRGGGGQAAYQAAMRSFLAAESLSRHPNTGVLLSTATMAETHEWSRYRSGIFSHQVLSALYGSADVNGDRSVDYHEVAAYVAAANLKVRDSRARLSIFSRPPRSNLKASLVDLRSMKRVSRGQARPVSGRVGAFLEIPRSLAGHYYLEDDRGVRYMDFNKSTEQPLRLALLDRPYYYLRSRTREAKIDMGGSSDLNASRLTFVNISTRSRGSVEQSFRQDLYVYPFGRSFAAGYATARRTSPVPAVDQRDQVPAPPWYKRLGSWKWIAAGTATAALATGITLQVLANDASAELEAGSGSMTMSHAVELQQQAQARQTWAGITFGVAASAAILTTTLFILDHSSPAPGKRPRASVGIMAHPGGAAFSFSRDF